MQRDMPTHRLKDHDVDWIQRMLKRIVQQGRKRQKRPEAYPLGTLRICRGENAAGGPFQHPAKISGGDSKRRHLQIEHASALAAT